MSLPDCHCQMQPLLLIICHLLSPNQIIPLLPPFLIPLLPPFLIPLLPPSLIPLILPSHILLTLHILPSLIPTLVLAFLVPSASTVWLILSNALRSLVSSTDVAVVVGVRTLARLTLVDTTRSACPAPAFGRNTRAFLRQVAAVETRIAAPMKSIQTVVLRHAGNRRARPLEPGPLRYALRTANRAVDANRDSSATSLELAPPPAPSFLGVLILLKKDS